MKIGFYNAQDALAISKDLPRLITEHILHFKKVETDEVLFYFVDKPTISRLHRDFFDDPSPTDCISFPLDHPGEEGRGHHILGEIFVCPQVACEYAKKHNLFPYQELCIYIIHGLLHLLGYEDQEPISEKIMRIEEKKCIDYLKQQNVLISKNFAN